VIRAHFGLDKPPFSPDGVELIPHQQDVLDTLRVHCQQGGLCLVVGEPSTGKSVIKQALCSHDPKRLLTRISCPPPPFVAFEDFPKNHNRVLLGQPQLLYTLSLTINEDIHSRVTYSAKLLKLAPTTCAPGSFANSTASHSRTAYSPLRPSSSSFAPGKGSCGVRGTYASQVCLRPSVTAFGWST